MKSVFEVFNNTIKVKVGLDSIDKLNYLLDYCKFKNHTISNNHNLYIYKNIGALDSTMTEWLEIVDTPDIFSYSNANRHICSMGDLYYPRISVENKLIIGVVKMKFDSNFKDIYNNKDLKALSEKLLLQELLRGDNSNFITMTNEEIINDGIRKGN